VPTYAAGPLPMDLIGRLSNPEVRAMIEALTEHGPLAATTHSSNPAVPSLLRIVIWVAAADQVLASRLLLSSGLDGFFGGAFQELSQSQRSFEFGAPCADGAVELSLDGP
jgi:hypothetical protein